MTDFYKLKKCLDRLYEDYGARYLDTDPVSLVHRYSSPEDIEVAGFIVSALAYGSASQIKKSAERVLSLTGSSPADFALSLTPKKSLELFRGFKHRWTDGFDIACLFWILGKIVEKNGSIGAFVYSLDEAGEKTITGVMTKLSEWIKGHYSNEFWHNSKRPRISYLVPSPADGSACKRLAMYFRWMVRGGDGVDFKLWNFITPSRLVIPVDSHIARMGRILGLTTRRSADWKMALEITDSLRRIDPYDQVKYDFALVRPGILGKCSSNSRGDCRSCALCDVCREALLDLEST